MKLYAILLLPLATGGCISTAAGITSSIVKAPFQVAGKAVDMATTSQEEADRNYGKKMRKAEAREGKERREYQRRCRRNPDNCSGYDGYNARD